MLTWMSNHPRPLVLSVLVLFLFAGCGGGDDTASPPATTGTIIVAPSEPDASWILAGPAGDGTPGSGGATLADMVAGDYTITWGDVSGCGVPSSQTLTLAAGDTATFIGNYLCGPTGFVFVPGGTFAMGSPEDEPGRVADETRHQVTLTHGFYIGTTEVTNRGYAGMLQWAYDRGYVTVWNGSVRDHLDGSTVELLDLDAADGRITFADGEFATDAPLLPVVQVTWYGAAAYCDWLNLRDGLSRTYDHAAWSVTGGDLAAAEGYRLPTEAEWEFACRAGSATAFATGEIANVYCDDSLLDQLGWYCGNAGGVVHEVAGKQASPWGMFDMHGNVSEWCWDWRGNYPATPVTDPVGPQTGDHRIIRGGFWNSQAAGCRAAARGFGEPGFAGNYIGFRVVRAALAR